MFKSRAGRIGAAAAVCGLAVAVMSSTAFASDLGAATITDSTHTTNLGSGTTTTSFSLLLPSGAKCQQDSTHGTVVYSFLVQEQGTPGTPNPAATDAIIQGLTYSGGFASTGYFLANSAGQVFPGVNVAVTTAVIPSLPAFTSGGLLTAGIPATGTGGLVDPSAPIPGVWEAGMACTLAGAVQDFWKVQMTFDANGGWTTPQQVVPESPLGVGLPLAGAAGLTGFVVYRRRRSRRDGMAAAA
jgi:hypothetical protein